MSNKFKRMNNGKEISVWNHYIDYLAEAAYGDKDEIRKSLSYMRNSISEGCSLEELKFMMLEAFEPITIMQGLEQWQNQMDLMLHTGLKKFNGESRHEHYLEKNNQPPYDFLMEVINDGILDDHDPNTHIYNLSGLTQIALHLAYEYSGNEAPSQIVELQENGNLAENYEITMLLGDCYRRAGQFETAIQTYEDLWEKNGHRDPSIQDAIVFTRFWMKSGDGIIGRPFDEVMDDYHEYRKQTTVRRTSPKISRNAPCPCGSGKKYKYCCGRNL